MQDPFKPIQTEKTVVNLKAFLLSLQGFTGSIEVTTLEMYVNELEQCKLHIMVIEKKMYDPLTKDHELVQLIKYRNRFKGHIEYYNEEIDRLHNDLVKA